MRLLTPILTAAVMFGGLTVVSAPALAQAGYQSGSPARAICQGDIRECLRQRRERQQQRNNAVVSSGRVRVDVPPAPTPAPAAPTVQQLQQDVQQMRREMNEMRSLLMQIQSEMVRR